MQILIKSQNPEWSAETNEININPDNDIRLSDNQIVNFKVPRCPNCANDRLKPDLGIFKSKSKSLNLIKNFYLKYFLVIVFLDQQLTLSIIN